jgi:hypothetical protein
MREERKCAGGWSSCGNLYKSDDTISDNSYIFVAGNIIIDKRHI